MDILMLISSFVSPNDSGCDNCNEWFHGRCIDITEKMAKAIREWYCMRCKGDGQKEVFYDRILVLFVYITEYGNQLNQCSLILSVTR